MNIDKSQIQIAEDVLLGENISIGSGTVICNGCKIGNNVHIGNNVYLDHDVIIRDNVTVLDDSTIGARCILGEYLADFYTDRKDHFSSPHHRKRGAHQKRDHYIW